MYDGVPAASVDSISKVAVVGASWTEYPLPGHEIPGSPYNQLVTRPDGTTGAGYGYFPKELGTQLGVSVDVWGYSGQRLDQTGFQHIDEVIAKNYDFIILDHFVNDFNYYGEAGFNTFLSFVKQYAKKCRQHGARLAFCLPCFTNGYAQAVGLGMWHENFLKGIGTL